MTSRLPRLFRLPLSLMNGIAALGGYCIFSGSRDGVALLAAGVGVTLLAMGASALNQVLERRLDALMIRTMGRPLPRGEMAPASAVCIASGVILAGCVTLWIVGGSLPVLLGLAALTWYLGVYTPLKQRTPLALPLGALCGAVPPVIGWCLAGGDVFDFRIILLAGLLYLWQVPHFWLFQHRHAEDYRRAGIPLFDVGQGVLVLWIVALATAALMLPAFGIVGFRTAYWYALFSTILLIMALCKWDRYLFSYLNLFPVLVTLTLLVRI